MIELGLLLVAAVAGVFWLCAALIGALFKITFGLFGALLGVFGAVFGIGIAALVVVPVLLVTVVPLFLPVLVLGGLIWLIVRASRPRAPTAPAQH